MFENSSHCSENLKFYWILLVLNGKNPFIPSRDLAVMKITNTHFTTKAVLLISLPYYKYTQLFLWQNSPILA